MSASHYKKIVKELSIEMFNIYNSMLVANEENSILSVKIIELSTRNEHLQLMVINVNALKDEVKCLKNKLIYADKIEQFLRSILSYTVFC